MNAKSLHVLWSGVLLLGAGLTLGQSAVVMGVDTGNPKEIGVFLTERGSLDSKAFAFQYRPNDKKGAFLGAMTGSVYVAGSGPQAGEATRLFHQRKSGLITRMVGSDRSRIDLRWDRKTGYRRAVVIVRDGKGKKLNSLSRTSIRAKSLDPSELLLSSDVPTYVNIYNKFDYSREEVQRDWGPKLVGLMDFLQKTVNNIIDKVSKVPTVLNAPGKITTKIVDTVSDFVKDRFEDSAWELVGNVTEKLREKLGSPRSLPNAITRNPTGTNEASDYMANDPNAGTGRTIVAPLAPTRGRPAFEPSSISLKPGESAKIKVVREYGETGVVAGIVSFAAEYSSADSPEDIEVLRPAYVFLDGQTGPHEITIRAKAKSTSTSQKSFYYRPATNQVSGENLLYGTLLPQTKLEQGKKFELINYSGSVGETVLSFTAPCNGNYWQLRLNPRALLVLYYGGTGNRAAARVRVDTDGYLNGRYHSPELYDFRGWVTWNGTSFKGSIPSITGGTLNADVEFRWDGTRYVGSYTAPITLRQTTPCTSSLYLNDFSKSGLIMAPPP